jgi:hypothetical protein
LIQQLVGRVALDEQRLNITLSSAAVLNTLGFEQIDTRDDDQPIVLTSDALRVRRGHEIRLIIPGPMTKRIAPRVRDEKLVALIAEAQAARELVMASPDKPLNRIASDAGRCRTRLARLLSLSCIAPDIVAQIIEGRQPPTLTTKALLATKLPLAWVDQCAVLGIA